METNLIFSRLNILCLTLVIFLFSNVLYAQVDSLQADQKPVEVQQDEEKQKKDKKRKDEFKVFAGVNINSLSIDSEKYEPSMGVGYLLGASYKRGRFFYWEVGARYNNPVYNLKDPNTPSDSSSLLDGVFSVRSIDVPITGGINILSITSRIVGLRVFVSAVPTFVLSIGDNDLDISKDNINGFNLFGQGGIGVDVAFLFLETGFNFGFGDLFTNDIRSKPYQVFVNLGFRF